MWSWNPIFCSSLFYRSAYGFFTDRTPSKDKEKIILTQHQHALLELDLKPNFDLIPTFSFFLFLLDCVTKPIRLRKAWEHIHAEELSEEHSVWVSTACNMILFLQLSAIYNRSRIHAYHQSYCFFLILSTQSQSSSFKEKKFSYKK